MNTEDYSLSWIITVQTALSQSDCYGSKSVAVMANYSCFSVSLALETNMPNNMSYSL